MSYARTKRQTLHDCIIQQVEVRSAFAL